MNITFPDGSVKQYEDGMTALQIAESISPRLRKATLAAEIDGSRADAFRPIAGDHSIKLLTWEDEDGRWTMRHTAAHILAQAVKRVHPEAKLAIPPLTPVSTMTLTRSPSLRRISNRFRRRWRR